MDKQNLSEREQTLINEIKDLYKVLLNEPNGRISFDTILEPDSHFYCDTADAIIDKSSELNTINDTFIIGNLGATKNQEIDNIRFHKHKYGKDKKPTINSLSNLRNLMNTANRQLRIDLYPILKDISL